MNTYEIIGRTICIIGGIALTGALGCGVGYLVACVAKWVRQKNELTAVTLWAFLVTHRRSGRLARWNRCAVLETIFSRMGRYELRNALKEAEQRAGYRGIATANIRLYKAGHDIIAAVGETNAEELRQAIETFREIRLDDEPPGAAR